MMAQLQGAARRNLIIAATAICSGIASYNAIRYNFLTPPDSITLVPGVVFGAVLAIAIAWKRKPDIAQTLIIIALTTLAWYLAARFWMATGDVVEPYFRAVRPNDSNLKGGPGPDVYKFGLVGVVTGLVGAVLTWAAVASARSEARSLQLLVNVAAFGAVAGAASETIRYAGTDDPLSYTAFLVFSLWQAGVALLLMNAVMKTEAQTVAA